MSDESIKEKAERLGIKLPKPELCYICGGELLRMEGMSEPHESWKCIVNLRAELADAKRFHADEYKNRVTLEAELHQTKARLDEVEKNLIIADHNYGRMSQKATDFYNELEGAREALAFYMEQKNWVVPPRPKGFDGFMQSQVDIDHGQKAIAALDGTADETRRGNVILKAYDVIQAYGAMKANVATMENVDDAIINMERALRATTSPAPENNKAMGEEGRMLRHLERLIRRERMIGRRATLEKIPMLIEGVLKKLDGLRQGGGEKA